MQAPKWLERLRRDGSAPYSAVPASDRDLLEQLRMLELVNIAVHGNRRRVMVGDADALHEWMERKFAAPSVDSAAGRRAAHIIRSRRSKRSGESHAVQPLLMRCFSASPDWLWAEATRRCGIIGMLSDRLSELAAPAPWRLVTIENWEPFVQASYTPAEGAIVTLYTSGSISETALRALAAIEPAPVETVHFGDFDWVGLSIYLRIRAVLPDSRFHVPDNIDDLFRTAANYNLARTQTPLTLHPDAPPAVQRIADLIARWNAGLEQEIASPPAF